MPVRDPDNFAQYPDGMLIFETKAKLEISTAKLE
jgi:hypothetical protein